MAFERFKEKHGGMGPLQAFYAGATEGQGIMGQWRPSFVRDRLGATLDEIRADADLPADFKELAESQRNANLTVPEAFATITGLQQRARDIRAINGAFTGFTKQQEALRGAARTEENRGQLDVLDTQAEYGRSLMLSSNPELQAMGRAVTEKVFAGQQSYATTNEAQELAAEATLGPERWTRYSALQDNYRMESKPFLDTRAAFGRINAALRTQDSPAGDQALVFNFMKMLDPGSTVLPGEYASASNTAGVPDAMLTLYNHMLRDGQRLTPAQREDFYKQAREQFTAAKDQQLERDTRYLGQARDVGIPDKMLAHFQLPTDAPGTPDGYGSEQLPAPAAPEGPNDTPADSTAYNVGSAIRSGAATAGRGLAEVFGGLFGTRDGGTSRPTDEYPEPPGAGGAFNGVPVNRRGQARGVFVPRGWRD